MPSNYESNTSVKNLQNYIRIRSVHPNVNYDLIAGFRRRKSWVHPPFEARIIDGVIHGRGVQDMKSIAIQYIEAVKRMKSNGLRLKRTLHITFTPDEELGGDTGMGSFVKTEAFRKLNVGFSLNEGRASTTEDYIVYHGERTVWQFRVICPGKSGHGSALLPDNSGEKIRYIIDKFMDLRNESKKKLAENPNLAISDVTTVNLTKLSGGVKTNIVPDELTVTFDVRITHSDDLEEFESRINRWCKEAGDGVTIYYLFKAHHVPHTKVDDTNPFWMAFKVAADQLKMPLRCSKALGGTDNRYIRDLGIPAFGFSPMSNTPRAAHEHNEHLRVDTFLKGIEIYEAIIPAVANV